MWRKVWKGTKDNADEWENKAKTSANNDNKKWVYDVTQLVSKETQKKDKNESYQQTKPR